jgi:putative ABC transport system permease protein
MRTRVVPIARRNLLADKVRLLVSVGGVTFAVLLILVVQSLYRGYQSRIGAFADEVPVDLWVAQQNTNGLLYPSLVSDAQVAAVAAVPGVARVVRLYAGRYYVSYGASGQTDIFFMAFDLPPDTAQQLGLTVPPAGQVVVDRVFATKHGVGRGDTLHVHGQPLTITAVKTIANAGLSQIAMLSPDDFRSLLATPGYTSFVLVTAAPGTDPAALAAAIERQVPGVRADTRASFAAANRSEVSNTFLPIVTVLLVVAFLVGAAVVGLTIYTATVERAREFGILKALGASPAHLFRIVLTQSAIVGVAGFLLGLPLTMGANRLAERLVPEFITLIRWQDVVWVFGAALGMALLAACIPIRRIARLDAAMVFRA